MAGVLETKGQTVTATPAVFYGYDRIVTYNTAANEADAVSLQLSGAGTVGLSDDLAISSGGGRSATVYASAAGNAIASGAGNDTLYGGAGSDTLNGGAGDDNIDGDAIAVGANDMLIGGAGNDRIVVANYDGDGSPSGTVAGGTGTDTVSVGSNNLRKAMLWLASEISRTVFWALSFRQAPLETELHLPSVAGLGKRKPNPSRKRSTLAAKDGHQRRRF